VNQVDERRHHRTNATLNQLLDRPTATWRESTSGPLIGS
jgi:hypothetical protein